MIPAFSGYCERAKFDYLLADESSASELISGEMLPLVQGWRTQDSTRMSVGLNRVGALPVWHFSEQDISEDSLTLAFPDLTGGVNRVRVQYTKVRDEYRQDFAEANDEFAQNTLGRVIVDTLQLRGISRFVHAEWLAKQTLDLSIARKQVDFKVHSHRGLRSSYRVVEGFELVTRDASGNVIPFLPAPAETIASPGWPTEVDAEDVNDGRRRRSSSRNPARSVSPGLLVLGLVCGGDVASA